MLLTDSSGSIPGMTQRIRPYRSLDRDKARDAIVERARETIRERKLLSKDVVIPEAPKGVAMTDDAIEARQVVIQAIRDRAKSRNIDSDKIRKTYRPMRQKMFERLCRPGEEGSFSLDRALQIAAAVGLKVKVIVT